MLKWKQFVNTGTINPDRINAIIAKSWERSCHAGVDPYQDVEHIKYKYEPERLLHKPSALISISYNILNDTFNIIKGFGFQLFLVDEYACVIECIPITKKIIGNWSEEVLGTNAIGTAILNLQAIQVEGAEHYCQAFHGITSSAVPILDNEGNLLGALGLIGPKDEDHSHVLSALVKAADKMMDHLTIDELSHGFKSISEFLSRAINSMPDGVLVLNSVGIIESVNSIAERVVGKKALEMIGLHFYDLCHRGSTNKKIIDEEQPFINIDVFQKKFTKEYHCETTLKMIKDENGHVASAVIFIRNIDSSIINNEYYHHSSKPGFNDIMGKSKKILDSIYIARMAANNMSNVLLQGESGTGKDILAQAIHNESSRRNGPFVAINCGAIPRELVSSELFGYIDGAFSGARRGGALGKFEAAEGGTLFLDEISDMPLESQVVLLRVLQDRKITRVGDSKEIPVDVRIICATNRNLFEEVVAGKFREDLYYRINVISIYIPPLRERTGDIALLAKYYLAKMGASPNCIAKVTKLSLMEELVHYHWPGNVRELQNVIERLVCICDKQDLSLSDLQLNIQSRPGNNRTINYGKKSYKQRKKTAYYA